MPRKSIKQTLAERPEIACGRPSYTAQARREADAREIERKHGSVLGAIAQIAFNSEEEAMRLKALSALAPYLFPQHKAVEHSGPGGSPVSVEITKIAPG